MYTDLKASIRSFNGSNKLHMGHAIRPLQGPKNYTWDYMGHAMRLVDV